MNIRFRASRMTRFAEGLARRVLPRVLARASDHHRQRQNQLRRDDVLVERMSKADHRPHRGGQRGAR